MAHLYTYACIDIIVYIKIINETVVFTLTVTLATSFQKPVGEENQYVRDKQTVVLQLLGTSC